MRKIAISLSKGGVGKSSTAVTIAQGLANAKRKVLLIDTDDQGQDAFLLGVEPPIGLAEVLNEEATIKEALFQARDNLWILAGGKTLSGAKRAIGRKDYGGERTLAEMLKPIEGKFDYVIIDTAPSWDTLTINAMFYVDEILTPVSLEVLTLNSLGEFLKSIDSVKRFNKKLQHKYVLPTFCDGRVKKTDEIMGQLQKYFPKKLCEPIRYNVKVSECAGHGKTILEYAPDSQGAQDYTKIIKRMIKDECQR